MPERLHMTTELPPSPPRREVWALAWPLILSNMSVPLLGMVDTAVVGHMEDPHHLGGVALGAAAIGAFYVVFASIRMGTTGLTAQAVGAQDGAEARACLVRPLAAMLAIGLLLMVAGPLIAQLAVRGFAPGPAVSAALTDYVCWRILGAPAALGTFVLLGWLLGNHAARSQLVVLVGTNVINAVLTVWFVLGLDWGVAGVGGATAIADYVGFMLAVALCRHHWLRLPGRLDSTLLWASAPFARLFRVNGDLILRTICLKAAFLGFAAFSARQGDVLLAANAVLNNLLLLQAYALDGFAFATEALVGRAVGRRSAAELDRSLAAAAWWSGGFALLIAAAYALGGPLVILGLTGIEEVREAARAYLVYAALVPLIGVWAYLFDGLFSGATQTRELRNGTALATLVFFVLAWPLVISFGNHGLWLAFIGFMAARSLWFFGRFLQLRADGRFIVRAAT